VQLGNNRPVAGGNNRPVAEAAGPGWTYTVRLVDGVDQGAAARWRMPTVQPPTTA
jgi:hypothetical protein